MKTGYFKKLEFYGSIEYNIVQEDGTAYHKYALAMDRRTMWRGQGVQSGGPDGVIYSSGESYIYKNTGVNYQDVAKVSTKIRNPVEGSAVIGITNGTIDILKDPGSIFNEWDYCIDFKDDPIYGISFTNSKVLMGGVYKETTRRANGYNYQRWCFPLNLETKAYKLNTIGTQLKNITNAKKIITRQYDTNPTSYILLSGGKYLKIFGNSSQRDIPQNFDKKIIDYGFGDSFGAALLENGYVTGWGYGITGLRKLRKSAVVGNNAPCIPDTDNSYQLHYPFSWPSSIQGKVSGIFIGSQCALALTNDGFLTGWGYSLTNKADDNCSWNYTYSKNPKTVSFPSFLSGQIKKVAVSELDTTLVLLKNGTMTGFGAAFSNNTSLMERNCGEVNRLYSGYIDDFSSEAGTFIIRSGNRVFASVSPIAPIPRNFYIDYTIGLGVKRTIPHPLFTDVLKIDTDLNVPQNFYSKISGESPFSLNVTSNNPNNPNPIQYLNVSKNIASGNENGLVTLKDVGNARIFVIQLGNEDFNPSQGKSSFDFYNDQFQPTRLLNNQIITVDVRDKFRQEITFSSNTIVKNLVEHKDPFLLATINSTLPITYTGYNSNIVEINNGYATIKNTGTTIITGIQTGDQYNYPAQNKSANLIVIADAIIQDLQLLTVQDLTSDLTIQKTYNDPIFYLPSVSDVGLSINYDLGSDSVAKIINNSGIMLLSPGIEQITAKQQGNDYYYPAEKIINLTVNKDNQTITFPSIPSQKFRKSIFYITGSSDSYLNLNYLISNSGIATIVGASGIKMLKTGTFQISGTQPGNDYYEAATPVVRNFTILKGNQTIKL